MPKTPASIQKASLVAASRWSLMPTAQDHAPRSSNTFRNFIDKLSELNGLKIWQTDMGNVYLEADTKEKVYGIVVGPDL